MLNFDPIIRAKLIVKGIIPFKKKHFKLDIKN
jgi:hypothetical protein